MGKFRLRLKVTGLEVELDGEREDLPAIRSALNSQFAALSEPVEVISDTKSTLPPSATVIDGDLSRSNGRSRSRRRDGGSRSTETAVPIEFRHDAAKYGNPLQTWSISQKSIWLLAVLKRVADVKEVSGPQLAATFNQYFKQAKRVHPPLVSRELGKAKVQNPAPVGEDKGLWYLTDEGDRQAQELIDSVVNLAA